MNRRNNGNGNENDGKGNDGGWSWWQTAAAAAAAAGSAAAAAGTAAAAAGTAAAAAGAAAAASGAAAAASGAAAVTAAAVAAAAGTAAAATATVEAVAAAVSSVFMQLYWVISRHDVPAIPLTSDLNSLLSDIYVRYIALKREDFQLHYRVFVEVFHRLHQNMKAVDKYYERYASNVQFAGSHYDHLRINKPDEFDMDIVIGVPVNMHKDPEESDIVIEQKWPGFVQLRAGKQYQKILVRDGQDCLINRTAHEWLDDEKYILRSKFTDWFKSVVKRGLNQFPKAPGWNGRPVCYVDSMAYTIRTTSSGPAWTIIIESDGFRLDVNLMPALKFPENRWLGGVYREIPLECRREYWMVVPKPNKAGQTPHDEQRSWRVALQDQEEQLLNNTYNLWQTIRLLERLRDAQGMKGIASYHIKTLIFWEVLEKKNVDRTFWQRNDIDTLFKHMLQKLYEALEKHNIPYFWNKNNNMILNLNTNLVNDYKRKLKDLLNILQNPCDYKLVARYLLSSEEYNEYQHFL